MSMLSWKPTFQGCVSPSSGSTLTLTLMVETEEISETLALNSTLTWLFAQEDFSSNLTHSLPATKQGT
jgi:hypothetical protein